MIEDLRYLWDLLRKRPAFAVSLALIVMVISVFADTAKDRIIKFAVPNKFSDVAGEYEGVFNDKGLSDKKMFRLCLSVQHEDVDDGTPVIGTMTFPQFDPTNKWFVYYVGSVGKNSIHFDFYRNENDKDQESGIAEISKGGGHYSLFWRTDSPTRMRATTLTRVNEPCKPIGWQS